MELKCSQFDEEIGLQTWDKIAEMFEKHQYLIVKMEAIENKKADLDLFPFFSTGLFDDYVDSHSKKSFKVESNVWNEISKFVK